LREVPLSGFRGGFLRAEVGDRLVVLTRAVRQGGWRTAVVNVRSGAIERVESNLQPAFYGPQSQDRILCFTPSKQLVIWNPISGARRIIAGS
jgi:hypothetical protein